MSVTASTTPITDGEKVYFCGHSFHMFIVRPLITLAKESGIKGHWAQGWDMIGGSTPMQHWERNGDDNEVKTALRSGEVDVLTLCSNVIVPEPAIDLFADLAVEHNPGIRVMVQHSWGDAGTGALMMRRHGREGASDRPVPTNEDRDKASAEDLAAYRTGNQGQRERLRGQIAGINAHHKREMAYMVPAGEAVLRAREAVVAGELPGVSRQSELFRDALGHATQPIMDLVSYVWLAALYRRSPIGSRALLNPEDPDAEAQHGVLQQIAWESVLEEPLSGVDPA